VAERGGECFVVVCVVLLLYAFAWRGREAVGVVEALVSAGELRARFEGGRLDCLGVFEEVI
jgi:hypothetical protein